MKGPASTGTRMAFRRTVTVKCPGTTKWYRYGMQLKASSHVIAVAAIVLCLACCDVSEPQESWGEFETGKGEDAIRPEIQAQLLDRAERGDWKAARDLALYRSFVLEKYDGTTLKLARQWAAHEPQGLYLLSALLSRSCKLARRTEAIEKLQAFIDHPSFSRRSAAQRRMYTEKLVEMRSRVDRSPTPCVMY